jgi:hypothetical protein
MDVLGKYLSADWVTFIKALSNAVLHKAYASH